MKSSTIALLAILGGGIMGGLPPIFTKVLYQSFEPMSLGFLRFLIASIFMLPIFFLQKNQPSLVKAIKIVGPFTIFSTLNVMLFLIGIKTTTANSGQIIYSDVPLVTAILSYFLIKERLSRTKKFGIILGFIGIILVIILPIFQKGITTGDLTGNIIILIATLAWAMYGIMSKKIIEKGFSLITISTVSFIISTIVFFIAMLFTAKKDFISPVFIGNNLIVLLFFGGVITVGAYVLLQWAIKHTSPTIAQMNQYVSPLATFTGSAIVLKEKLTAEFVFGAILVLIGLFIATSSDKFLKKTTEEQVVLAGKE